MFYVILLVKFHSPNSNTQATNSKKYQQIKELLERKRATLPWVTLAGLFDKNCIVTHSNTIDGFDASNREYCKVMISEPKRKTFISHAFMSNMGFLNLTQTRKFNTEDGFLGMVAFGINLTYFSDFLHVLQNRKPNIIQIIDTNMRSLNY